MANHDNNEGAKNVSRDILSCSTPSCITCRALYEIEIVGLLLNRTDDELISALISHCKPTIDQHIGLSNWITVENKRKAQNDKSSIFTQPIQSGPMTYTRMPPYWCICISVELHSLNRGEEQEIVHQLWNALKPMKPLLLGAGEEIGYLRNAQEVSEALIGSYHRQIILKS